MQVTADEDESFTPEEIAALQRIAETDTFEPIEVAIPEFAALD